METKKLEELSDIIRGLVKKINIDFFENVAMPDFANSKEQKPLVPPYVLIKEIKNYRYSAGFWYVDGDNTFRFIIQIKDLMRPTAQQMDEMKCETCPEEFKRLIRFQPRISCSELLLEAWMWEILYSVRQRKEIRELSMDLQGVTENAIITYTNKRYFRKMIKRENMPIVDVRSIEHAVKSTHNLFVRYANGEVDLTTNG